MFSIIVPVYNTGRYLEQCVESVIGQTFSDWELILINDGSTDNSQNIIDNYVEKDIRIKKYNLDNKGRYFARRKGFSVANGEYIICLDSDDYWENNCLERIKKEIDSSAADVVMFCGQTFGEVKNVSIVGCWMDSGIIEKKALYKEMISSHKYNSLCLKAFKKELLQKEYVDLQNYNGISIGEDKVQLLQIITSAKRIVCVKNVLYNYRKRETSSVKSFGVNNISQIFSNEVFKIIFDYMKVWDMVDFESEKTVATYYLKNYVDSFFYVRKMCRKNNINNYRDYKWKDHFLPKIKKYLYNNYLDNKDKIKLWLIIYFQKIL